MVIKLLVSVCARHQTDNRPDESRDCQSGAVHDGLTCKKQVEIERFPKTLLTICLHHFLHVSSVFGPSQSRFTHVTFLFHRHFHFENNEVAEGRE